MEYAKDLEYIDISSDCTAAISWKKKKKIVLYKLFNQFESNCIWILEMPYVRATIN